jgi:hypothetical protein
LGIAAAIFLAACAAAGFGITYWSGVALNFEERMAFGVVMGAMVFGAASFVVALAVRDVTVLTVGCGLLVAAVLGVAGAWARRPQLAADWSDARARWLAPPLGGAHPWPLLAVVLVCGIWTVHFLHQAYVYAPNGLYAGYPNIWGDWAAHLTFAGSFAYGHNFPPEFPVDPGHNLGYPFMIDFFAADLVPLGVPLTAALTATSGMLGLALPAVLYLAALRFAGGRAAATLAVFVFVLSGGFGFVRLLSDVGRGGLAVLQHLPHEYTINRDLNYQWLNPVLAYLIPQRSTLFGFSLTLIVLLVIWLAVREGAGWPSFLFAGLVAGLMPVFHVHAFGTVVALTVFWALFKRRREWWAFFVPALLVGVPILAWMWPSANTSDCGGLPSAAGYCIQAGWLAPGDWHQDGHLLAAWNFIWFWIQNTSLLIPLMIAAHVLRRWFVADFPTWISPMWLWFIVPNLIVLQPWVWDNTKFFIFWALFGSVLAAGVLAGLFRRGWVAGTFAAAMVVLLCLSGALDLSRAADFKVSSVQFTDAGGLQVAAWAREHTSPMATFVVADEHNSPIPTLSGRRILIGYPGWLWTYGLPDYIQKGADNKLILTGDASTPLLVAKYGIDYVMIGPQELSRGASRAYWDQHATRVYESGDYVVYDAKLQHA